MLNVLFKLLSWDIILLSSRDIILLSSRDIIHLIMNKNNFRKNTRSPFFTVILRLDLKIKKKMKKFSKKGTPQRHQIPLIFISR